MKRRTRAPARSLSSTCLALAAAAALALSACSSSSTPSSPTASAPSSAGAGSTGSGSTGSGSTPAASGQFQNFVGAFDDIASNLDAAQAADQPSLQFVRGVYETLVNYDPVKGELVGAIADSWQASPDATSFTLHLRPNVMFHDGSTLTADGVKASLDRTIAIGKGESYLISGVQSVDVVDPSTITIKVKSPNADFLFGLTRIFIVSGQAIKDHTTSADPNATQWFSQHEAGSGPYKLTSWTPNDVMVLDHFPDYWQGWSGPHIGQYTFNVVPQEATQRLMIQRGDADSANAITPVDAAALKSDPNLTVSAEPGSPMYIILNPVNTPLSDVRVRKAIAESVDYNAVDTVIMKGFAQRLSGPATSGLWAYDTSLQPTATNLADAKQLLQEAGYGPSHPLTLSLDYFNAWAFETDIATLLQNSLSQIGVTLTVQGMPWATFSAKAQNTATRADMGIIATYVPTPSPGAVITSSFDPASQGGWAYWGYNNPQVTALLGQAMADPTDATRKAKYEQLQQMLVNDYAAVWLMQQPDIFVFRNDIKGYVHDTAWGILLNYYGVYKG